MSGFSRNTVFKSTSTLESNFHRGEHREEFVVDTVQSTICSTLRELSKVLTKSNFIEGVLAGSDVTDLGFDSYERTFWHVNAKVLPSDLLKWVFKLFQSPKNYIKDVQVGFDSDGFLYIEINVDVTLNKRYVSKFFEGIESREEFSVREAALHAMYNSVMSARTLFIKNLVRALRMRPGLDIDSLSSEVLIDVSKSSSKESSFVRNIYRNPEDYTKTVIWRMASSKILD